MNNQSINSPINNIKNLAQFIINNIKSEEDKKNNWKVIKKENKAYIEELIGLGGKDIPNSTNLFGFDIDFEEKLLILNYSGQAHNTLHKFDMGWTEELRIMRGLIFSFKDELKIASKSFEKFFNFNELDECSVETLSNKYGHKTFYTAREKADGHMIQYFSHNNKLNATTRGKFKTNSAAEALRIFSQDDWNKTTQICSDFGYDLMSLVTELCTKETKVFVDYGNKDINFLLALYDTNGNRIHDKALFKKIESSIESIKLPKEKSFTLNTIVNELKDRSVSNNEGWVMSFNDYLVKFKYETYIGMMVESKLSYKYIMQCIMNNRLEKMIMTLPEELYEFAKEMQKTILKEVAISVKENTNKNLYALWTENEGSVAYYRTVCRNFIKFTNNINL